MRRAAVGALVAAALAGCSAPPDAGKGAAVGVVVPLSGPDAATGQQIVEGMRLAAGGSGVPLEILPRDSHGSPGVAHRRFQELADEARVVAVAGGWSAATARAVAALAAARGVPFLALSPLAAPSAPAPAGVLALHRLSSLGIAGARFAREDLGAGTAGIVRRPGGDAARVLSESFRAEFESLGGRIGWDLELDPRARTPAVAPADGVQVVWILGGGPVTGPTSDLGPAVEEAIFLVPEGWPFEGLAPLAASGRSVRWVSFFAPADTTVHVRDFLAACDAAAVPPTTATAVGWDAMHLVLAAVREEGESREGIARALASGGARDGATGGAALPGGTERPAVSAVTSEGLHFLRRIAVPAPASSGKG